MALFGLFVCVFVAVRSFSAEATVQKSYFVADKTLELRPDPGTQPLTSVLWKFSQTQGSTVLVAEWNKGEEVEYYPSFKESAHLDTATGVLTVKPVNVNRAGVYNVEVNLKLLDVNYEAILIEEVPTPKVWIKPGSSKAERALSCMGDVSKAGPVSYWWDINANKSWVQMSSDIILQDNPTQNIKDFSCKVSNPVGEKESDPHPNPFYIQPARQRGLWALLLLLSLLVVGVLGVIAYKRGNIRVRCPPGVVATGGEASGNEATSATHGPESHPLKEYGEGS